MDKTSEDRTNSVNVLITDPQKVIDIQLIEYKCPLFNCCKAIIGLNIVYVLSIFSGIFGIIGISMGIIEIENNIVIVIDHILTILISILALIGINKKEPGILEIAIILLCFLLSGSILSVIMLLARGFNFMLVIAVVISSVLRIWILSTTHKFYRILLEHPDRDESAHSNLV